MISNVITKVNVREISMKEISYAIIRDNYTIKTKLLVKETDLLPIKEIEKIFLDFHTLPNKVGLYQNKDLILLYRMENLLPEDNRKYLNLEIEVDSRGDCKLFLYLTTINKKNDKTIKIKEVSLGLEKREIEEEQDFICLAENKFKLKQEQKTIDMELLGKRNELETYYNEVLWILENSNIGSMKRDIIEKELSQTKMILQSDDSGIDVFESQMQKLKRTVNILIKKQ
jgi:hypothetical protein